MWLVKHAPLEAGLIPPVKGTVFQGPRGGSCDIMTAILNITLFLFLFAREWLLFVTRSF